MQDYGNSPRIDPRATFSRSDTASSGDWNASTNSPGLVDGSGTANQYYRVSVGGTQDLGSGSITYAVGDYVKYSGSVWFKTTQPIGVTYWSNEKHLSSDNLLTYSNPNNAVWNESNGATVATNAAAAPDGTTTASSIVEDSANSQHRTFASINATSGQAYTLVAYLKANGRTIAQVATSGAGAAANVEFDLSGSGTATTRSGSPSNSSISQIGSSGWYRCSFQVTAGSTATLYLNVYLCDSANSNSYTGDGSSGVYAYGFNLSTTGQLVHEDTSGQIHREYAPTLKSVATAGQPRFEYDPASDGQSAGTSLGILIESQATNLVTRSHELNESFWNTFSTSSVDANVAVAPDGTLTADLIRPTTSTGGHYVQTNAAVTTVDASTYTLSAYVKAAGLTKTRLYFIRATSPYTTAAYGLFTLTGDGSVEDVQGSASISPVGNGWYRISVTGAAVTTLTSLVVQPTDNSGTASFAGDGYSGILCTGVQYEANAFASSLVSTSGSAATRALESLSVVSSSLFDNGSGALAAEYDMFAANETSYVLQTARSTGGTNNDGVTVYNSGLLVNGAGSNTRVGNTTSNVFHKVAASWQSGSQKISRDGGAVAEDTTTVVPQSGTDKLFIGVRQDGGEPVNGHIKRVAIYNEALSDTNLQALTS